MAGDGDAAVQAASVVSAAQPAGTAATGRERWGELRRLGIPPETGGAVRADTGRRGHQPDARECRKQRSGESASRPAGRHVTRVVDAHHRVAAQAADPLRRVTRVCQTPIWLILHEPPTQRLAVESAQAPGPSFRPQ